MIAARRRSGWRREFLTPEASQRSAGGESAANTTGRADVAYRSSYQYFRAKSVVAEGCLSISHPRRKICVK